MKVIYLVNVELLETLV